MSVRFILFHSAFVFWLIDHLAGKTQTKQNKKANPIPNFSSFPYFVALAAPQCSVWVDFRNETFISSLPSFSGARVRFHNVEHFSIRLLFHWITLNSLRRVGANSILNIFLLRGHQMQFYECWTCITTEICWFQNIQKNGWNCHVAELPFSSIWECKRLQQRSATASAEYKWRK